MKMQLVTKQFNFAIMKLNLAKVKINLVKVQMNSRQTIKIAPALALLQLHRPNIGSYMVLHWVDIYFLSELVIVPLKLSCIITKFTCTLTTFLFNIIKS